MLKTIQKTFQIAVLVLFAFSASAKDEVGIDPHQLVQEVASKTFVRIKAEQSEIKANPDQLKIIVEQELLPWVDYKFAALKVLGKHYKKVPKKKLLEYVHVFRDYLVSTYAQALTYYKDQEVVFEPARQSSAKNRTTTVRVRVRDEGKPDIKVAFKVRKNKKTKQWKAYDMSAEGISLLSSKQSEFEGVLRQQGIDTVIEIMKEKIGQPITLNPQKKTD